MVKSYLKKLPDILCKNIAIISISEHGHFCCVFASVLIAFLVQKINWTPWFSCAKTIMMQTYGYTLQIWCFTSCFGPTRKIRLHFDNILDTAKKSVKLEKPKSFKNHSKCRIWILVFFTNFCPIDIDLAGNTVWPQASGFQKLAKLDHF